MAVVNTRYVAEISARFEDLELIDAAHELHDVDSMVRGLSWNWPLVLFYFWGKRERGSRISIGSKLQQRNIRCKGDADTKTEIRYITTFTRC